MAKISVKIWKVMTDLNLSDIRTKPLTNERVEKLTSMIGMTKLHLPKVMEYLWTRVCCKLHLRPLTTAKIS